MLSFFENELRRLKEVGLEGLTDELQRSRVMLLNRLVLVSLVVCIVVFTITAILGRWQPAIVNFSCIFVLLLPTFHFQKRKQFLTAQVYFIIGASLAVCYLSYIAIQDGHMIDVENVLFGLAAAAVLLFEGGRLYGIYFSISVLLISLKIIESHHFGDTQPDSDLFIVINNIVALAGIFIFNSVFRRVLYRLLDQVEESSTRLRHQKERLEEQEHITRAMIDNVPVLLALVRRNGRYMVVNKIYGETFEFDAQKASELNVYGVLPDNILEKHTPLFQRVFGGETVSFEDTVELPNGGQSIGRGRYIPLFDEKGTVYAISAFVVDITDLKKKERQLAELNHTKNKLFSIIAHDIRAPIGSLQGLLELWEEGMIEPEEFGEMAGHLKKSVSELAFMLENLLHWARGQLDGFSTQLETIDLTKIIQEKLRLFKTIAAEKDITIQYKGPEKAEVQVDSNQCRLILRNLLSNAIKFSRNGGTVTIRVNKVGTAWECSVEDSGEGMSEEQIQQILRREVSSSKGTAGEVGTGLGLVLVQEMVANNGGSFGIESESGVRSRFWLRLP